MANLKAGTLIGGNLIWSAGNLPLRTQGDKIYINDTQIYSEHYKPTPAAIGAVNKAGDTMTGTLTTKQIKVTDQYALTTSTGGSTQGIFLGFSGSDRRTIIGGGDAAAGTVIIRPRGIGDAGANTIFNNDGTITSGATPTSGAHLTRKDYVDSGDAKRLLLTGGTLTGRLSNNYTSSMKMPAGTVAQRGSGVAGDFRFNTEEKNFEGYDGAEWRRVNDGRVLFTRFTANFTAVKGKGHLVDTTKAGIVATLPSGVKEGDFVVIGDGSSNASKNPFYVAGYNGDRVVVDSSSCVLVFTWVSNKWVITDGIGETGALDSASFVKKAGDTMLGDLKITLGKKLMFPTPTYANGAQIWATEADKFGANLFISSGGATVVGSGESAAASSELVATSERLYLTSDNEIHFISGANTWADRKTAVLSASGRLTLVDNLWVTKGGGTAAVGRGTADSFVHNSVSNKYLQLKDDGSLAYSGAKVYHSEAKPTAAELGVVNKAGDTMTGRLTAAGVTSSTSGNAFVTGKTSDGSYAAISAEGGYVMLWKRNDSTTIADEFIGIQGNNLIFRQDNKTGDKKYTDNKVYHTKFKPTAADVGAIPTNTASGTPVAAYYLKSSTGTTGTKIRLPFLVNAGKMVSFTVRVYQEYIPTDIQFSGYLYTTNNQWYLPKATVIAGSKTTGFNVKMGRDADGYAYVWLEGSNYRGVAVFDVVGGYSYADWNSGWVISETNDAPNLAWEGAIYPPYSPHFKPTAQDVVTNGTITGSITSNFAGDAFKFLGGSLRSNTASVMALDGKSHSFVTAPLDAHLCSNAYWDDGAWRKYNNAKVSTYAAAKADGTFKVYGSDVNVTDPNQKVLLSVDPSSNLSIGGALLSSFVRCNNAGNPLVELHTPGKHASMMWLNGANGELNIGKSNGSGGEVRRMATWEPTTSHLRNYGGISIPTASASWGSYSQAGAITPLNADMRIGTGEWHPMVVSPYYIHSSAGYSSRWSIGHYRSAANSNGDFVLNMKGDGYLANNQRFHFTSFGELTVAGTHNGQTWTASGQGFTCSRVGNIIDWCVASFSNKAYVWQAVGTYAMFMKSDARGPIGPGGTCSGSQLNYCPAEGRYAYGNPPGTWQCLGQSQGDGSFGSWNVTIWVRIA